MIKRMIAAALAIILAACPALAWTRVEYENAGLLECALEPDGQILSIGVKRLDIIGIVNEGIYLIAADGIAYYASESSLEQALEGTVDLSQIERLSDVESMQRGSRGTQVQDVQSALIALGYLNDVADGSYGLNTVNAVRTFQRQLLPLSYNEDGIADGATQYLALALANESEGEITLEGVPVTPELKYPAIARRLASDLTGFCGEEYTLSYDSMEDKGSIDIDQSTAWQIEAEAEIDSISFELSIGLEIEPSGEGLRAIPVIKLYSLGARRPYVHSCIVRIGESRYDIAVEETSGDIQGKYVAESAIIRLGSEGLGMLEALLDNGTAQMRIEGKYRQFDVQLSANDIPALDNFTTSAISAGLAADVDAVSKR
ncbi:MAG: peptidoglycan-binding domain-containing protein [Clostridia bacterium]|nr:peptidoglycan-binding domain-containing protein [Clostridia bacterium]